MKFEDQEFNEQNYFVRQGSAAVQAGPLVMFSSCLYQNHLSPSSS